MMAEARGSSADVGAETLVWKALGPISAAFALLLGWTAWDEWRTLPPGTREAVAGADVVASLLLGLVAVIVLGRQPRPAWAHPLAVLVALSITSTHLVSVAVQGDGTALVQGTFIVVGQAMVMRSMRWFLATLAVQAAAWTTVITAANVAVPGTIGFSLQVAVVLAVGVQWSRNQAYDALLAARDREREQRVLAERARDDLQDFAHVVAHDLRSPLAAIQLKTAVLAKHSDLRVQEAVAGIDEITAESARFIDGLLQFSRAGKGARRDHVDLNRVLEHAMELSAAPVHVEHDAPPDLVGDATLLQQLFLNLINNAYAYRDPSRELHLRLEHRRDGEMVELRFCDNGSGIGDADPEELFRPFRRGTDQGDGHGLGLATCARIATAHGGTIHIEPQSVGTCFVIRLPAADKPVGLAPSEARSTESQGVFVERHGRFRQPPAAPGPTRSRAQRRRPWPRLRRAAKSEGGESDDATKEAPPPGRT